MRASTPSISLVAPSKLTPACCSSRKLLEAIFSPSYLPSRSTSMSSALHPVRVAQARRSFPDMPAENFAGWGCKQAEDTGRDQRGGNHRKTRGFQNAGAQGDAQVPRRAMCMRKGWAQHTFMPKKLIELAL